MPTAAVLPDSSGQIGTKANKPAGPRVTLELGGHTATSSQRDQPRCEALVRLKSIDSDTRAPIEIRFGADIVVVRPLCGVTVGSCATGTREPGQGRKAAALSDASCVPQIAWPSLHRAGVCALVVICVDAKKKRKNPMSRRALTTLVYEAGQLKSQEIVMFTEFREFLEKFNVIPIAVGLVLALAFQPMVDAVVGLVLSIVAKLIGIDPDPETGAYSITDIAVGGIDIGSVINAMITFVLIAFIVFMIVKAIAKAGAQTTPAATPDQDLLTEIRDLLKAQQR